MKKFVVSALFASTLLQFPAFAQDSSSAAAIAERQAAEERYAKMSADVESVLSANATLQKRVAELENEVQKLREEQSRLATTVNNSSTADSVKRLADKIQEVDRKREADKDLIVAEFAKLGKKLEAAPVLKATPRSAPAVADTTPDKGYPYTVQSNDTLSGIVSDFNSQFKAKGMKTITMKQVMDANPNVNWNRLQIGQKIFVPAPPEK